MNPPVSSLLRSLTTRLTAVCGPFARSEAETILMHLLGCSRTELLRRGDEPPGRDIEKRAHAIAQRRSSGEPLAYILGSVYFFDREIAVNPATLIPRPDTEILCETILHHESPQSCCVCELGTGSGCIAAVLAAHRPAWHLTATDCSIEALHTARQNCPPGTDFVCANGFDAFASGPRFDIIVSNPPYIPTADIDRLNRSVKDFEPRGALDGGTDGLDYYRMIVAGAPRLCRAGCRCYVEIGFDCGEAVTRIFSAGGWKTIETVTDNESRPRVIQAHMYF